MPPLWLIDAFADRPFTGNPAAICFLERPAPDSWMQSVAMEMNQAETAFIASEGEGFRLRWFTPAAEVDLCGHATLASAHFLWATARLPLDRTAVFQTRSGRLTARRDGSGIVLDFPATPPIQTAPPAGLLQALGVGSGQVFVNQVAQPDYLVLLESGEAVRRLRPVMSELKGLKSRGVIVTGPADRPGIDFVSRFFAPGLGIDEDPVTGSAHCTLAPFWSERLNRPSLTGFQASSRGGTVGTVWKGDRVELTGTALTVLEGTIAEPA